MLRAVFAVTLAVAMLAVTVPAMETAGVATADTRTETAVETVIDEMRALAISEDPVPKNHQGARRFVTVRLPARSWTTAGVEYVSIDGAPGEPSPSSNRTAFAWKVTGGTMQTTHVPSLRIRASARDGNGPLVLERGGRHRLRLSLVAADGERPLVVVDRPTFKTDTRTRTPHANASGSSAGR